MLTIDDLHIYRWNGNIVPGVTEILFDLGFIKENPWAKPEAKLKGQYAHKAIQYYEEGDLDMDSVDPDIQPYFDAWVQYRHWSGPSTDPKAALVVTDLKTGQKKDWHALQVAGYSLLSSQLLLMSLNGKAWETVVEKPLFHQLLGYAGTPDRIQYQPASPLGAPREGRIVYLQQDSRFKVEQVTTLGADERAFLACLTVYNRKRRAR